MPPALQRAAERLGGRPLSVSRLARRSIGVAIAAGGALALAAAAIEHVLAWAARDPRLTGALEGGLLAAAATALGTLPVLLSQRISVRAHEAMLGFGAGVMLAASAFSLTLPALRAAAALGLGPWGAGLGVAAAILAGALVLQGGAAGATRWRGRRGARAGRIGESDPGTVSGSAASAADGSASSRTWLFVIAIALHNLPEGLAIGVAHAAESAAHARALTTGIALQDVPEGLVVALAVRAAGCGRLLAVAVGVASGLLEPVAALGGAAAIAVSANLLPWGLAFAAGAMLYAIAHEAIPSAHERGRSAAATGGILVGFVLMMVLDTTLG